MKVMKLDESSDYIRANQSTCNGLLSTCIGQIKCVAALLLLTSRHCKSSVIVNELFTHENGAHVR